MILPGRRLTSGAQAQILAALVRVSGLPAEVVSAAFIDADRGRAAALDPLRAARQAAYRATAGDTKHAVPVLAPSGTDIAAHLAQAHDLSAAVAGILVGAALGLRLGLDARRSHDTAKKHARPKLAAKVARHLTKAEYDADLGAAREFGRDMDRVARGSVRRRKTRR